MAHDDDLRVSHGYSAKTRDLSRSLLYVLPLLLVYEVGVIVLWQGREVNGASAILKLLGHYVGGPEFFNIAMIAFVAIAAFKTQRRGGLEAGYFVFVVVEAVAWGFITMVFAIVFTQIASDHAPGMATMLATAAALDLTRIAEGVVISSGAGVYEEIVFRLILMMSLIWLFARLMGRSRDPGNQKTAVLLGVLVSSVLFAAAHHIGPDAPMTLEPMVFRTVCGFFFGVIFLLRGLAVAVYTHAVYDIYAIVLQPMILASNGGA